MLFYFVRRFFWWYEHFSIEFLNFTSSIISFILKGLKSYIQWIEYIGYNSKHYFWVKYHCQQRCKQILDTVPKRFKKEEFFNDGKKIIVIFMLISLHKMITNIYFFFFLAFYIYFLCFYFHFFVYSKFNNTKIRFINK